ncbi:hypothetical protein A7982_12224 [Minicystis rosea]|nr:hypothetical protein A7982_12224 [Minicystis rosea]
MAVTTRDEPPYEPLGSLAEARETKDGMVILEGDYGGQIYLVAPAAGVDCSEGELSLLLRDLDEIAWPGCPPGSSSVRFERLAAGETVPGGMGGGRVEDDVWIHPELAAHATAIRDVLAGRRETLAT